MMSRDEYRRFADECIRWAHNAKTEESRRMFLDMAAAWTELATKARSGIDSGGRPIGVPEERGSV
jgi:hypothetical protein